MTQRWMHASWAIALTATLAGATPARAQDEGQRTQLHGFGSWIYGRTDDPNKYVGAEPEGNFRNSRLALNASSELSSRLSISSQVEVVSAEELEVELDYAFASWKFSDAAIIRAGAVKLPFGIWSEVFDVGTARPFLELPQAVYGPVGSISERYSGLGLTGAMRKTGWGLRYDVFFGGLELEEYEAPEEVLRAEEAQEHGELEEHEGEDGDEGEEGFEEHSIRDAVGGRIVVETPLSGFSLGASAYTGREALGDRRTAWGVQAEYVEGPWSLRSEYVGGTHGEESRNSFYAEAARRLGRWQVAGRYDRVDSRLVGVTGREAGTLLGHESWSAGLNYWFSPEFVLKANVHRVDGNRLAGPGLEGLAELAATGALEARTNAFQFGAQFTF